MSASATAPALTLLPPDAPPPAAPPRIVPLTPERARQIRRMRVICTALVVTGALLPVPCIAAAPWLHGAEYLGMGVSWVFLLPAGGLALLLCTLTTRTTDDARALLLAFGAFAAGTALMEPAARVGDGGVRLVARRGAGRAGRRHPGGASRRQRRRRLPGWYAAYLRPRAGRPAARASAGRAKRDGPRARLHLDGVPGAGAVLRRRRRQP
ncbi:MAG TPA: hypothetical protein VF541_07005, partial [Longimicrobium sp.]